MLNLSKYLNRYKKTNFMKLKLIYNYHDIDRPIIIVLIVDVK